MSLLLPSSSSDSAATAVFPPCGVLMFPSADLCIFEVLTRVAIDSSLIVALRTPFPNSWASWLSVKSSYTRPARVFGAAIHSMPASGYMIIAPPALRNIHS